MRTICVKETESKTALPDCPHRILRGGTYASFYLDETPQNFQVWAKSIGYPDKLFQKQ